MPVIEEQEETATSERTVAILDEAVASETGFQTALAALNNITRHMEKLTSNVNSRRASLPTNPDSREMKSSVDGLADDLQEYANGSAAFP
jgi:hypothetical protein